MQRGLPARLDGLITPFDDARIKIKLSPAPEPELVMETENGPLPVISKDGRKPWQVYARPAPEGAAPKIAIMLVGLGFDRQITSTAIDSLPPDVTLAFDVQSPVLGSWLYRARQLGHETLLDIPAEPLDFPRNDAGPGSLLTSISAAENVKRLQEHLKKGTGYVGLTTSSGVQFMSDLDKVRPMLAEVNVRGLLWVDQNIAKRTAGMMAASAIRLPAVPESKRVQADMLPETVVQTLDEVLLEAQQNGYALGVVAANKMTIEQLNLFLQTLADKRGMLVPVSALVPMVKNAPEGE
ncbi:MAG: divergent polysaccharide deacetylase family protein [Alphaproteobacteria bacterium]|nr:divergent polysaccharide deacetylase family protein [Alphaproteobacteria bacterium]